MPEAVELLPLPAVLNGFDAESEPDFEYHEAESDFEDEEVELDVEDADEDDDEDEPPVRTTPVCHVPPADAPVPEVETYQAAPVERKQSAPAHQVAEPDDPFGEGPPMPDDWVVAPRPEGNNSPPSEPPARKKAAPAVSSKPRAAQVEAAVAVQVRPDDAVAVPSPVRSKEVKLPPYIVPPDDAQRGIIPPNGGNAFGTNLRTKKAEKPRMVTVILHPTGNKTRDQRCLQRLHGLLRSCPGLDRFSLMIHEAGKDYLVEFPNNTTGINPEMLRKISAIIGEDNVRVTPVKG